MDSLTVCRIMETAVRNRFPDALLLSIPVADGGEGTVDSFLRARGGEKIQLSVSGPFLEAVDAFYGLLDRGKTAVIEMAAAAGLPLVGEAKDPLITSTYGVGQLILDAVGRGAEKIILGLGGSATNDGGCGAAAAAGIRFYRASGESFVPVGGTLHLIDRIDASGRSARLKNVEMVAMCDIDNPMFGPRGAAHVFAPQKGADEEAVECLDSGLRHLAELIRRDLGLEVAHIPGAGAAGAMGAGAFAFFGASLEPGIEAVLDTVGFESLAEGADLILTGEGKIDRQSLRGKVVIGVSRRAKKLDIPVVAIVGDIGDDIEAVYQEGVNGIFSINRVAMDFNHAKKRSEEDLALTVDNLMRFIQRMSMTPD